MESQEELYDDEIQYNTAVQDTVSNIIESVISQYVLDDADNDENGNNADDATATHNEIMNWFVPDGSFMKKFTFTESTPGIKQYLRDAYQNKEPYDFFKIFITEEIIDHIVMETNRYAEQLKSKMKFKKSRLQWWRDTTPNEIEKFLGIILWMGLCNFPKITNYWSSNIIYNNNIKNYMTRNRFELILRVLHFNNNEDATVPLTDRLRKLSPFLSKLKERFQEVIVPAEELCIDETIVPFRGRLAFRQYIKNKRHKYGVKLYKLCLKGGYTYDLNIYCGKDTHPLGASANVVLQLTDQLLDKGRTTYTDNFYTSVTLAHKLLEHKTHLVGTVRPKRKFNNKEVETAKLRKSEVIARESDTGVLMLKWKDRRDVLALSTKHTPNMIETINKRGESITKPELILDYNKSKAFIDLSDQLKSYNHVLRRGVKWYRKIAFELILGTSVVNSYILYKEITKNRISITEFKEKIIEAIFIPNAVLQAPVNEKHELEDSGKRNRCVVCYKRLSQEFNRKTATNKSPRSPWKCTACSKHYCVSCFFEDHVVHKI